MALALILMTSLFGAVASVLSLVMFGAGWGMAFAIYVAVATVPAAIVLAGVYAYLLISQSVMARQHPVARTIEH
ncbi:MAG: hypothetical protein CSA70_06710 [Rhodobacterales bacterium]|nr:MAG: hypothetical protein CSA70_06710 [Rhodobacterales bacterium]